MLSNHVLSPHGIFRQDAVLRSTCIHVSYMKRLGTRNQLDLTDNKGYLQSGKQQAYSASFDMDIPLI